MAGTYTSDTRAYAPEVGLMQEEPPLVHRLESVLGTLVRGLAIVEELNTGPRPEKLQSAPPVGGVLQLGSECEKAAKALENELMIVSKRIGRL